MDLLTLDTVVSAGLVAIGLFVAFVMYSVTDPRKS
jgi:hypothetical protein